MIERVLEPEVWAARMRTFLHACVTSTPHEETDRVREAASLLQCGAAAGAGAVNASAVEQLLACGAAESAVLAMLGPETVFMLSRGQGDGCLATVIAAEGGEEIVAEGATLALALLSAYVAGLVAGAESRGHQARAAIGLPIARLH